MDPELNPSTSSDGQAIKERNHVIRRASDRALIRTLTGICIFLFLVNVIFGTYIFTATNRIDDGERDLRRASASARVADIASCERVKSLRHEVNSHGQIAYEAYKGGAERERALAQRDLSPAARKSHKKSAEGFQMLADSLRYRPQTDCIAAVDHPERYKPPAARPYKDLKGAPVP